MAKQITVYIFSGFLGAGKTTLIKKLIKEVYAGEKVVLIENEFGEIGIDGGFLADAGITVNEMNSGCICCSLVGDFGKALSEVIETYLPDRIIIEPSGVGKLSDIIRAVEGLGDERLCLNGTVAVVDAKKCKMYMKNFGEFFNDQIESAGAIVFSHVKSLTEAKLDGSIALVREHNPTAAIVSTDWDDLAGCDILAAMEHTSSLQEELTALEEEHHHHHGHHHHHDEDEKCTCGHHHHHDEDEECTCGHHHHHDEDEECTCGHHHHHEEDEECSCGHHHGHYHHHAEEVFTSCGFETSHAYSEEELLVMLEALEDEHEYGMVLRAKGIVASKDGGEWFHFDYVPGEPDVRRGKAGVIGRLCVIGAKIDENTLKALFQLG
ncbi:MAG: GTP-binding protein [Clostridia bacterium]|nr:GTP-binding protein [Clostridia bacterium]